ncbi:glycosyltransferase [Tianweitania sp. BSSL-BM11]|uniref:Glycosyltransferase n=1 Tax=Tianweitania aestuarii TaxID=2814886 RepID=A0ABS5RT29_9HYPH|nr:glycosyltransferase family 2 protein [Tianweitania aestuarii]MBS9719384.1 glycosyltransferase [Tianweitania aestuarii]
MSAVEKIREPDLNDNSPQRQPQALEHRGSRLDPFEEACEWLPILHRLGIQVDRLVPIATRARANKTSFHVEFLAADLCSEDQLYRAIADDLQLTFLPAVEPARLAVRDNDSFRLLGSSFATRQARPILYVEPDRAPTQLVGAVVLDLRGLRRMLREHPERAGRMAVAAPSVLRRALIARNEPRLTTRACDALANNVPDCSANIVATVSQGFAIGAVLVSLPLGFVLWPSATMLALHLVFSLFFLGCVTLRMLAARHAEPPYLAKLPPVIPAELPTYTIMIALYREAVVVPELLASLGRIVWPRAKLEIKLVCEADDAETLAALRAHTLRPWVEVIEVPAQGPRTKPKALTYALPLTSGALVAIYDAEDKPHPLQLLEAWQTFRDAPPELACLQAPLVMTNAGEGMIQRLFAFEYAALFRGLLPWLSSKGLVLPLGGTSNHFRRDALEAVGAWDPFNVTEDADLGLRLTRFGYRCGTITYPTFEEAPHRLGDWVPQRTRWFKGWLQTWLVHMRNPLQLRREIGTASFLIVQVLFAGMVISALAHPLMLVTLVGIVLEMLDPATPQAHSALFAIDAVNIACGYAAFLVLGAATLVKRERKSLWKTVLATPVYWMMISYAAWRAAWHLYSKPFHWEKTPHRISGSRWVKRVRQLREQGSVEA